MQLSTDQARKLIVHLNEKDTVGRSSAYKRLLEILHSSKVMSLSIFRGIAGSDRDKNFQTIKILELSSNLPIKIEAIVSEASAVEVIEAVCQAAETLTVEVSDIWVVRVGTNRAITAGKDHQDCINDCCRTMANNRNV